MTWILDLEYRNESIARGVENSGQRGLCRRASLLVYEFSKSHTSPHAHLLQTQPHIFDI